MTAYSSNKPHNGQYIVYINGIEVPTKSVSQRFGVWQIPEMVIEMVADPVLTRLGAEDRVQVTVFFLDDTDVDPSVKPTLRLFGDGEITGWGYQGTKSSRSIVFTCINHFAILHKLTTQFLNSLDDMTAQYTFAGRGTLDVSSASSQIIFPYSLFKQGLIPSDANSDVPDIVRPFEFLYNVVRNMIGANVPAQQRSTPAANFFARWVRLTNFQNRFAAMPFFDEVSDKNIFPVLKALQTVSAVETLTRSLLPQIQNAGSMLEMVQLVYQTVFMEVCMLPTMPLVTVDLKTQLIETTSFESHRLTQLTGSINGYGASTRPNPLKPNRIPQFFVKPQFLFGLPPACNVIFPAQVISWGYDENYSEQPTRMYFNDETINRLFKLQSSGLGDVIMNELATAYPPEADAANKARLASNARTNGKNFLLFPEEFFKGPVMDRRPVPPWLFFLKSNELQKQHTDGTDSVSQPSNAAPAGQEDLFETLREGNPDVYGLYAEYEFFRERYAKRGGSAVLVWQPFIVPGFPCFIFDERASRVDVAGYITFVTHKMTQRSRSTNISYTYGRTLQEMFDLMSNDFALGASAMATGPREPIRDIRKVVQDFAQAETMYQKLFYGARSLYNKDASCDWRKLVGYASDTPGQPAERIFINGPSETDKDALVQAGQTMLTVKPTLDKAKADLAAAKVAYQSALDTLKQISTQYQNGLSAGDLTSTNLDIHDPRLTSIYSTADQHTIDSANATLNESSIAIETLTKQIADLQPQYDAAAALVNNTQVIKQTGVIHNLDGSRELVPLPGAETLFSSYDAALKYNWRPLCTLDEYVIFHDSIGEGAIPATGHVRSVGARYFERIRRLTPLPTDYRLPAGADGLNASYVTNPAAAQEGTPDPVTGETDAQSGNAAVVPGLQSSRGDFGTNLPADFPQTRADWDKILLAYRANVYKVTSPQR